MLPPLRAAVHPFRAPWQGAVALLLILGFGPVQAGGPLLLTAGGQPYRWDMSRGVRYAVSPGPFGSRSHDWAAAAAEQAFQTWEAVPTARIEVAAASDLPRAVTGSSLLAFLNSLRATDPSPVLFDNDGSMLDTLVGKGASLALLGIGGPLIASTGNGRIYLSFAILNAQTDRQFSDSYVHGSFIHELGHMLNMAHSQVNSDELFDGDPANDGLTAQMFYRGPNDAGGLSLDDQAWISWLYPNPDTAGSTGTIRGRVLLPDGQVTGLQGVQVIARRVGDPQVTAVGSVSGFDFQNQPLFGLGGGLHDPAHLGDFLIPGLPPGSYTVELAPLAGFPSVPVPIGYLVGGPKLWEKGPSTQDVPPAASLLEVKAGQEIDGIDIVVNGDNLGNPTPVAEHAPNMIPNAQPVTLPAVISGTVDSPSGTAAGHNLQSPDDLQRVYTVYLSDWTVVTATLTTPNRAADLDLFVLGEQNGQQFIEAASAQAGTPPEVVQIRLPPGRHYFGVHVAGLRGGAYTLSLLATPAPDPVPAPVTAAMSYLLIGDVTPTSAVAHWETSADAPSVVYYNLPVREIGSTKPERVHSLSMTDLTPGGEQMVQAYAASAGGTDALEASVTPAVAPAAGGSPNLEITSSHISILSGLDLVIVHLANTGTGDALNVSIDQLTPARGWTFAVQALLGVPLPSTLNAGEIGAGGAGAFAVVLFKRSGFNTASVTLHGSYTDASGTLLTF